MNDISTNIDVVRAVIAESSVKANRSANDVVLVAVTKNVDADRIISVSSCGIDVVGENRVQEARDKKHLVKSDIQWHLIGHLQKNKVKMACELFDMIHSVDDIRLLEEIDRQSANLGKRTDVLFQTNIAKEKSKFGMDSSVLKSVLCESTKYEHIAIKGIMTMAPQVDNIEDVRWVFRDAKKLYDELSTLRLSNVEFIHLSMGMSHDYPVAIEEGATMIRVGSAIFKGTDMEQEKLNDR